MFKLLLMPLMAAGCVPAACQEAAAPAAEPVCVENFAPGVVQIKWENTLGCDLRPPQTLTVVFDERSYGEGWGGDAALAWAQGECDDMGGRAVWHDGLWLECADVDY